MIKAWKIPCFLMDLYNVFIFKSEWTYVTDCVDFSSVLHGLQIAEYSENLQKLDLTNKEELRKYLPYSRELPSYIRTLSKSEIKAIPY